MDELKQVFLQESFEQLDALESLLLELENRPDDETTLNGIFRAAHTIKGAAGMVECAAVESFAHVVENVLDRLRSFPGAVLAIGLNTDPPIAADDNNIVGLRVGHDDPPGAVAHALFGELTVGRRGRRSTRNPATEEVTA